jgi:hypothetical protein
MSIIIIIIIMSGSLCLEYSYLSVQIFDVATGCVYTLFVYILIRAYFIYAYT